MRREKVLETSEHLTIDDLAGLFGRFEDDLRETVFVKDVAAAASTALEPVEISRAFLATALSGGDARWGAVFASSFGTISLLASAAVEGLGKPRFAPVSPASHCADDDISTGTLPNARPPHLVSVSREIKGDYWMSGSAHYASKECVELVLGFRNAEDAPHAAAFSDALHQLAAGMHNARLYALQRRAANLGRLLDDADNRMLAATAPDEVFEIARASLTTAMRAREVKLALPDETAPHVPRARPRLRVKGEWVEASFRVLEGQGELRLHLPVGVRSLSSDERDFMLRLLSTTALAVESLLLQMERERLMRAREEWVADLSHDIRTPLASIRGYAELLSTGTGIEEHEVQREAGLIARQAKAIERLVEDLHSAFRLRSGSIPVTLAPTDLVPVTEEALEIALWHAGRGRQHVPFEHSQHAVLALVDPSHYSRIVTNLAANAFVHNPPETKVWAHLETDANDAHVTIADSGLGMDPELVSRVHRRGERGSTGRAAGSGLGMAIVHELASAIGGTVDVKTTPGEGTEVTVSVPLVKQPTARNA